jgi:signal recognition particle subunit SRP54
MKDFEGVIDEKKAAEEAAKMLQGRFSLNDFLEQIRMIKSMGPLKDIFEKLPFFPDGMPEGANLDDRELVKAEAIVSSMTREERVHTELFKKQPSRLVRVARGSGRDEKEVSELLERFTMMRDMMGSIGQSAGMFSKLPGMKQLNMARQMKNAMKGGGFPGMPGMGGGFPGMGGGGGFPGMPPGMGLPPGLEGMEGLEQLMQGMGRGGPGGMFGSRPPPGPGKKVDKEKKKQLKKMQKKSRKKGR